MSFIDHRTPTRQSSPSHLLVCNNVNVETRDHNSSVKDDTSVDLVLSDSSSTPSLSNASVMSHSEKRPWAKYKRKNLEFEEVDKAILKTVDCFQKSIVAGQQKINNESDDEDQLFCLSLVATLKRLGPREKAIANMQMLQALFNLEFPQVMLAQQSQQAYLNRNISTPDGNGTVNIQEQPYF